MTVESATYIDDLNAANPVVGDPVSEGDDHLRLVKSVLQSQFTSLGSAAVTVTAAQINDVVNKLDSTSVLDDLADVDTTTTAPVADDILVYDGSSDWVPAAGPKIYQGEMTGYASQSSNRLKFTAAYGYDSLPSSLATIDNSGTYFKITAGRTCRIDFTLTVVVKYLVAGDKDHNTGYLYAQSYNSGGVTQRRVGGEGYIRHDGVQGGNGDYYGFASCSGSMKLVNADDYLSFLWENEVYDVIQTLEGDFMISAAE